MINNIKNLIKTTFIKQQKNIDIDYNTWIFSSSNNEKFNYNSKYLFEYVLNNLPKINPIFIINDDELRSELKKQYGSKYFIETKSNEGIKKVLSAGVWFTSAGLPIYGFNLSKNRIIVNLWHGIPLKKIALMENKLNIITRLYFNIIFSNNYTHILTTSTNLIDIMAKSFNVNKENIKVWGQPRNDKLFIDNDTNFVLNDIYNKLPDYNNIILYAPTFRSSSNTNFFPFKDFNLEEFNEYLDENKLLLFIRCHQSEKSQVNKLVSNRIKLMNSDKVKDINEILNIFDLLITDYSSIYIDFLLTGNPVIFLPYDKDEYLKKRGLNFNYEEVTPGPKPDNLKNFKVNTIRLLNDDNYYKKARNEVKSYFYDIKGLRSPKICNNILDQINKIENNL